MSDPSSRPASPRATVTVFASPSSWIESDAVRQCRQVAALNGMLHVAGMPDLHPGKGAPVGAAMSSTLLYPHLAGSDLGCGIAVFPIRLRRVVPERLAARFPNLDLALDPDRDAGHPAWRAVPGGTPAGVPAGYLTGLGTVGRGNHFAELARIGALPYPPGVGTAGRSGSGTGGADGWAAGAGTDGRHRSANGSGETGSGDSGSGDSGSGDSGSGDSGSGDSGSGDSGHGTGSSAGNGSRISSDGIGPPAGSPRDGGRGNASAETGSEGSVPDVPAEGSLVLLVHSGSRGLGEHILRGHTDEHGARPAPDPAAYLAAQDEAVRWASVNRRVIAARIADALGAELGDPVVDVCHNAIELRDGTYLHRKGAAPGDGLVLVAGSRGTPSYLVAAHAGAGANFSVAHGAGRKLSRADALRRGQAKHTVHELRRTPLGSLVICGDRHLLFEEAPDAYKRIDQVIADLAAHGLATPLATTTPVLTYKTPDAPPARARERDRGGLRDHRTRR